MYEADGNDQSALVSLVTHKNCITDDVTDDDDIRRSPLSAVVPWLL